MQLVKFTFLEDNGGLSLYPGVREAGSAKLQEFFLKNIARNVVNSPKIYPVENDTLPRRFLATSESMIALG